MAYSKIALGSKVYYRGDSTLYVVRDRYTRVDRDGRSTDMGFDEPDTRYELVTAGEPDSDFIVERHQLLDRNEIKTIHDTIMEAYANG